MIYVGIRMWLDSGKMTTLPVSDKTVQRTRGALVMQGFVTAIANPKAWALTISLLPPFINKHLPLLPQLLVLLVLTLVIEWLCLLLYAAGGSTLRHLLQSERNLRLLNRVAGTLMFAVGMWLAVG